MLIVWLRWCLYQNSPFCQVLFHSCGKTKQNNRDRKKKFLKVFLTVSEDSVSSHLASSVFEAECYGGQQVSEPRGAPHGARK